MSLRRCIELGDFKLPVIAASPEPFHKIPLVQFTALSSVPVLSAYDEITISDKNYEKDSTKSFTQGFGSFHVINKDVGLSVGEFTVLD